MSRCRNLALIFLVTCIGAAASFAQALYWENPQVFFPKSMSSSISAAGSSLMALAWQEIRPGSPDGTSGDIFLSVAVSSDGITWTTHSAFFGPIHYTGVTPGNEPRVYSLAMDSQDRILVAVAPSERETVILRSTDGGASFQQVQRLSTKVSIGVPNLFTTSGGGFLLFVSQGSTNADLAAGSVALAYSHSSNGRSWSELAPFVAGADAITSPQLQPTNPQLQPAHASLHGAEYVVFQSLVKRTELTSTWQLFEKQSPDGGATWDTAIALAFGDTPQDFDNERPRITALGDELGMVWERSPFGQNRPQIWSARLDSRAVLIAAPEIVAPQAPSRFAQVLMLRGQEYVLYSNASARITLAQKGKTWQANILPRTDEVSAAQFPHAVQFKNSLFIFWENQVTLNGPLALVQLRPLLSVGAPVLSPDFTPGKPTNRDTVTVNWTEPQPPDPSGIREYRYSWTYSDGVTTVEKEKRTVSGLTAAGKALFSTRKMDQDGTWTFSIVAEDLVGNVTAVPAVVSFIRKATPPRAVSFEVLGADGSVMLSAPPVPPDRRDLQSHALGTNTFTIRWLPGGDKYLAGYSFNIQQGWPTLSDYLQSSVPLLAPPERVVTTDTEHKFDNSDNGVYVLTVRALDQAGNLGPPSTLALELEHYQVVTRVDNVTTEKDPVLGSVKVTIHGRGFRENGQIEKIFLNRGQHSGAPGDIQIDPATITITDREISGITLNENTNSGAYQIGFLQRRPNGQLVPFFVSNTTIEFQSPGTVKIGNFQILLPNWIARPSAQYVFSFDGLLVLLVVALLGAFSILAFRKIVTVAQEGIAVRTEVMALLEGRPNPSWEERKRRMQALKRKGLGLRVKFTLLMVVLVTMIVLIVSIPLGFQMVSKQRSSLATGLQNSANILLGALVSSAETPFRQGNQGFFGAPDMPNLRSTMAEAVYTTITGPTVTGPDPNTKPTDPKDLVWASDDKRFADELKAGKFRIAQETVDDEIARSVVPALQKKIDADAATKLTPLVLEYQKLQGLQKGLMARNDALSRAQLSDLNERLAQAGKDIDSQAKSLYGASGTLEQFNLNSRLLPTYLFYKPVIFFNRAPILTDTTFYQGMVRLEVKTDTINRQIDDSFRAILRTASAIALAAIALGILGAIILANITVTPIGRLVRGVEIIRDTEDKEKLKDHTIQVGTRDEIGSLADTVNEMTQGLVKAAIANKELLQGIDVQKRFLPLGKDRTGGEASTTEEENARVEIFGYYKGAKGVSGDYFDFRRLDDSYYALIKCDVSGKGISAALIMVEVATLFINYFRDWPKRKDNIMQIKETLARQRALSELERLDPLVYTINDLVEERGFTGRFAALTVLLYNSATGVASVCNAGDWYFNFYSTRKKCLVHEKLPNSPAAGIFPSMTVDLKTPYKQVAQRLEPGDVLFLSTDGFEDSEHLFRDANFQPILCDEPGLAEKEHHKAHGGDHEKGEGKERLSAERVDVLINAVMNRGRFTLVRNHNAIPNEEIVFDFSTCRGTAQEAVLAQVAVDRVYRMVPDPRLGEESKITVESKVADFLKAHFLQYERYFSHRVEAEKETGTVTFSHAMEDDQADDLTVLVVRRK